VRLERSGKLGGIKCFRRNNGLPGGIKNRLWGPYNLIQWVPGALSVGGGGIKWQGREVFKLLNIFCNLIIPRVAK
jgi:hypothetical protein